ncbi:mediator of RNA polymerase II mRNAion subunit 30-like [Huso huso]|uniref:Mediator of RNA polymerase II transcription subunit 30 n=1 Tax=Huso huso TaxID=61971 RepID=A0ABR0YPQ2_HUSHU
MTSLSINTTLVASTHRPDQPLDRLLWDVLPLFLCSCSQLVKVGWSRLSPVDGTGALVPQMFYWTRGMTALPVAGPRLPGLPPQAQASLPPQSNPGSSQPPQGVLREIPPAILCKIGQETVQDIVSRSMEIFHLMRATQLPNGVTRAMLCTRMLPQAAGKPCQLALLFRKRLLLIVRDQSLLTIGIKRSSQLVQYLGEEAPGFQVDPCDFTAKCHQEERLMKILQKNEERKVPNVSPSSERVTNLKLEV